jgi:MoxR-like ATPase
MPSTVAEPAALPLARVAELADRILDEVERAVVGKRGAASLVLAGLLSDGHVLLEDLPGLAKTLLARSFASATTLDMRRVQFTPDLMPADLTGSSVFDPRSRDFDFRPGPVFTNLLLGDEINRAPPKTQAALLEAMQERQVTVDGETRVLDRPFLVLATQNPIEFEGTYPLPEAQLDRFLLRVTMGYPSPGDEREILGRRVARREEEVAIRAVADRGTVVSMQRALEDVYIAPAVIGYIVDLVGATRLSPKVQSGASPRGSAALLKITRAIAALDGRDFVTPDDVKATAVAALGHRLVLRPELWVRGGHGDDVVRECLDSVPTPAAADVVRPS